MCAGCAGLPNIRVSVNTLRALRHVRALMTLMDDREHSLDDALQMVLSYFLENVTLRTPEQVRAYADLLEKAQQALKVKKKGGV